MESGKRLSYYNAEDVGFASPPRPVRSRGRPKGKPKPFTADERRVRNAQLERGRRDVMADAFQSLRESLGQESTTTRADTLMAATAFLKKERDRESLEALRRQNMCLEQQIVILEEAQKAKSANLKLDVERHSPSAIGAQYSTQSYKDEGNESPSNSPLRQECPTQDNCTTAIGVQYSTRSYNKDEDNESPSNSLLRQECLTKHNCSTAVGVQYSTRSYKDEDNESPSNSLLQRECLSEYNCSTIIDVQYSNQCYSYEDDESSSNYLLQGEYLIEHHSSPAIGAQYSTQSYKDEASESPSNSLLRQECLTEYNCSTAIDVQYSTQCYKDEASESSNYLQQDCLTPESEPWSPPPFEMDTFRTYM